MFDLHHASKLRASAEGLTRIKRAIKAKGWTQSQAVWCELADVSRSTLGRFWERRFIYRDNFIAICQAADLTDWQSIVDSSELAIEDSVKDSAEPPQASSATTHCDWGDAPDVLHFHGRTSELAQLKHWVGDAGYKLIAILGMGGIGKTALAVKLVQQCLESSRQAWDMNGKHGTMFPPPVTLVVWRSLRNAPPLNALLTELIAALSPDSSRVELAEAEQTTEQLIDRLLHCLQQQRCFIVLDNAETVFRTSDYSTKTNPIANGDYRDLIQRLGREPHQSCCVITSREPLPELSRLAAEGRNVGTLSLSGVAAEAGQAILSESAILSASTIQSQSIVNHYAGNPLALKIVAAGIQDIFHGDGAQFLDLLTHNSVVFSDIDDLLHQQIDRLSPLAQEALYWLAIAREPVSVKTLHEDLLTDESKRKLVATLEHLKRRSLIEKTTIGHFTLQPVVMEYGTNHLIEQVLLEITTVGQTTPTNFHSSLPLLVTHALIQATAKDYVREMQTRLTLKPIAARCDRQHIDQLLATLHQFPQLRSGYAAGNLLNLLTHQQVDLSGYDFSGLTIWQAYLRHTPLHQVNVAQADLAKSVFGETFGNILCIAFSPDGKTIAAGTTTSGTSQWRLADGRQLLEFSGHQGWCFSVAYSPDGQTLATGGYDTVIKLWNAETGAPIRSLQGHTQGVAKVAFSPDGRLLASASADRTLRLWCGHTGTCLKILEGHEHIVRSLAFSPDGQHLASCSMDGTIRLWDVHTRVCLQILKGHTKPIHAIAYSPDGQTLASGGDDRRIRLWDTATGECLNELQEHQQAIYTIAYSSDGNVLASAGDDAVVKLWNLTTNTCFRTLTGHQNRIWTVAFSPDGRTLISGGAGRLLKLWDIQMPLAVSSNDTSSSFWREHHSDRITVQCSRTLQGYHTWVVPFGLSIDDHTLLTNCGDGRLRLWDLDTGECTQVLHLPMRGIHRAVLSPDRQTLAAVCFFDNGVRIFDATNGNCVGDFQGHTDWITSITFSPDNQQLASTSGDTTVKLWHRYTGECLHTLRGHKSVGQCAAFSPNGQLIASGSWDCTIKLWSVATGECLATLKQHTDSLEAIAFSPDGQTLASCSQDCTIQLWDVVSGNHLRTVCTDALPSYDAFGFSADGQFLFSAGLDATIRLWWIDRHQWLGMAKEPVGRVYGLVLSSDGRRLISGNEEGILRVWQIPIDFSHATTSAPLQCSQTLQVPRLYEGLNITGVTGLTKAQKGALKTLGAWEC